MSDVPTSPRAEPDAPDAGATSSTSPERGSGRWTVARLPPRRYHLVDRVTKLVGILAIGAGLGHAFGALSIPVAALGLLVGVATVFVEVESPEAGATEAGATEADPSSR